MYAIYGKIYHQYTPNVTIYNMDSIGKWGKKILITIIFPWISHKKTPRSKVLKDAHFPVAQQEIAQGDRLLPDATVLVEIAAGASGSKGLQECNGINMVKLIWFIYY